MILGLKSTVLWNISGFWHRPSISGFEVDLRAGELRRQGFKAKLQEQPFQILAMLLDCRGAVITREEVQRRLWPANTFVDFDAGKYAVGRRRQSPQQFMIFQSTTLPVELQSELYLPWIIRGIAGCGDPAEIGAFEIQRARSADHSRSACRSQRS